MQLWRNESIVWNGKIELSLLLLLLQGSLVIPSQYFFLHWDVSVEGRLCIFNYVEIKRRLTDIVSYVFRKSDHISNRVHNKTSSIIVLMYAFVIFQSSVRIIFSPFTSEYVKFR